MKKLISIISIFVCAFAVFSCSDDDMGNPYAKESSISIESSDVLFQAPASEGTIECVAPNGIARVESSASWCRVELNGTTIRVFVDKNSEKPSRSCTVRIYASDNDYTDVVVQQMGLVLSINTGNNFTTSAAPKTAELPVSYSGSGNLTVEDSSVDWVTFTLEDGVLKMTFLTNVFDKARTTEVKITDGDVVTTMTITQEALFFIVNEGKDYVSGDGASTSNLSISTVDGIDYSVAASTVDWAEFSIVGGQLRVKLTANNTGNLRQTKAIITYAGGQTKEVNILQFEFEKDILGEYTLYYGSSGTTTMDCELVKTGTGYGLKFMGSPEGTVPITIAGEEKAAEGGTTMTFGNTDFVGDWSTSSVTTDKGILLLLYLRNNSVYRTASTTDVGLTGKISIDSETSDVVWTLTGKAPSGSTFYGFRVANTTAGTYSSFTAAITTWTYPKKFVKK